MLVTVMAAGCRTEGIEQESAVRCSGPGPSLHKSSFFLIFNFWLHWVFIAALRLSLVAASRGCSLVVASRGCSLVAVRGLLVAVASLVVEHWL